MQQSVSQTLCRCNTMKGITTRAAEEYGNRVELIRKGSAETFFHLLF
jgi:hypothetical protein